MISFDFLKNKKKKVKVNAARLAVISKSQLSLKVIKTNAPISFTASFAINFPKLKDMNNKGEQT